jgi:hypothetical protein
MNIEIYKLAEKQFLSITNGHASSNKGRYFDFQNNNNTILFRYHSDSHSIWVNEELIWNFFKDGFGLNYVECVDFLREMFKNNFYLLVENIVKWKFVNS